MKCLIVLSLLCIAAAVNANTQTDDDILVEKLLKRYEEQQVRKRTLEQDCEHAVRNIFSNFIIAEDEAGEAVTDMSSMETACEDAGSTEKASEYLKHCIEKDVAAAKAAAKRSKIFARQSQGNCANAAIDLNNHIGGGEEVIIEQICDAKGGVHPTIVHLSQCVTVTTDDDIV